MPNRLLLLIPHCLFWVNQISWCQICVIWHLLLLANYWRKDKLVTVHAAISVPWSKGTGSLASQYVAYWNSMLRLEDEKPVAGEWGWNPGATLKPLTTERHTGASRLRGLLLLMACSADSKGSLCPVVSVKLILLKWLIWFKWLITFLLAPLTQLIGLKKDRSMMKRLM